MIKISLGNITTTSTTTAVQVTFNQLNPQAPLWVQAVSFQALGTNTNTVFICDRANPNFTTGVGLLWEVPAPSGVTSRPAWVLGDPSRPNNAVNVSEFYIVPSNSGEGVRVSAVRSGTSQSFLT